MNSDKQSFQKPSEQHSNWQQKQSQPPKPQSGHQSKPTHQTPSDRTAGHGNVGKK
jgi:hypothetical protein